MQQHCCLVDMNPPRKSKPGKVRPVVVIQASDVIKLGTPGITIVPVTSQLKPSNILRLRLLPSRELLLKNASDVLIDQIHTIDAALFLQDMGTLADDEFNKIMRGVRFHLGLD